MKKSLSAAAMVVGALMLMASAFTATAGPASAEHNGENCEATYKEVVDKPAYTETVEHDAEYEFIEHPAVTKTVPGVWANWAPNNTKGPQKYTPIWPTDKRGKWILHNQLPPGHAGPDGVYRKGQGNSPWFYRQAEKVVVEKEAWTEKKLVKEAWAETIEHEATYKTVVDKPGHCEPPTTETPPTDLCPNLDGDQETVPDGMVVDDDGDCVTPPPPTDVCPNIDGDQATVPDGMVIEDGKCVTPPVVTEPPVTTPPTTEPPVTTPPTTEPTVPDNPDTVCSTEPELCEPTDEVPDIDIGTPDSVERPPAAQSPPVVVSPPTEQTAAPTQPVSTAGPATPVPVEEGELAYTGPSGTLIGMAMVGLGLLFSGLALRRRFVQNI